MTASRPFCLAAALVAAALVGASAAAQAQQTVSAFQPRVTVTGEGSVSAVPDYAQFRAGVTTRGKTAKEAADANTKQMTALIAMLADAGIAAKDIRTSRYSLQPIYAPPQPNTEPKLAGFSAANQVTVTIRNLDSLGDLLDRLVGAGATDIGSIEFLHSDQSKLMDQARDAAIADARRKAEIYAHAANVNVGNVVWISEESVAMPSVPMMAVRAASAGPPPIAIGEDHLKLHVTVSYELVH